MAGVNKMMLIGNVGKDPEARALQNGGRVVSFSVATGESWTDKQSGERREKTQWHRVVIFNDRLGEIAEKYLRKGSKVFLEGSYESRKYQDKDGVEREIFEVVLANFRGQLSLLGDPPTGGQGQTAQAHEHQAAPARGYQAAGNGGRSGGAQAGQARAARPAPAGGPSWEPGSDLDDEIPF